MSNNMERIEKFEKLCENLDFFVYESNDFLYEHISDPTTFEIIECTRAIVKSNINILAKQEESLEKIKQTMSTVAPVTATITSPVVSIKKEKEIFSKQKNLKDVIELVTYSYLEDETLQILKTQSHKDILRIKLHFLKKIIETKNDIKKSCLLNPQESINKLQSDLEKYMLIVETISEFEQPEKNETIEEEKTYSNIIFASNGHRSTYLLEDIIYFPEKSKEIKKIIDKIVNGYFLKTKDTKRIDGYQQNLYEYKHPNGIRILYMVEGHIITICSLFMKDKQKSSKISNEYEEAISRYDKSKSYIIENFNNPDFHIEQDELLGEIYQFLEGSTLSKKVGAE